ncbi:MAG TPA: hypothetical protein VEZ12_20230 [Herpetosiphonaceae bacterium]|nr:hypothetical protein [Herpetosiphonaceae bacterium]
MVLGIMVLLLCEQHQRLPLVGLSRRRSARLDAEGMQEVKRY